MPHIAQPQISVRMTARGSGATHTPTEQEAEPGESTDVNIYEQMRQGVDVKAQNTGTILWRDRTDNTASPSHSHVHVRVPIYM
jgi:hypothetical protein